MLPLRNRTLIPRHPLQPWCAERKPSSMIGQTLERYVAGSKGRAIGNAVQSSSPFDGAEATAFRG